jgi:predicted DNA-binding transcriptional regulator AlpA
MMRELIRTTEVARILGGVHVRTIHTYKTTVADFPRPITMGRLDLYDRAEIEAFAQRRKEQALAKATEPKKELEQTGERQVRRHRNAVT